jgi:hypothetical protein
LIAPAVAILIITTLKFTIHVPFWDQWELVEAFRHKASGTLSWRDFWVQHNEHRIVLPRLIMYGLAQLTHWDPFYEVTVNLGLGLVIAWQVLALIRKSQQGHPRLTIGVSLFAAYLLLSPAQWENWLWGWQIQWFLSLVGLLGMTLSLVKPKLERRDIILAAFGALTATYSLGNGFIAWIVGFIILISRSEIARAKKAFWLMAGLVATGLHHYKYVNPAGHPSKSLFLHEPPQFIKYVLVYLGRPLGYDFRLSIVMGAALAVLFVSSAGYLMRYAKRLTPGMWAWFGLGLYGGASAVVTAISRLGLGVEQAYASRYTTVSNMFTLATTVLLLRAIQCAVSNKHLEKDRCNRIVIVGSLVVLLFGGYNYIAGIKQMRQQHRHLVNVERCLRTAKTGQEPCLMLAYPNQRVVWDRLIFLREHNLGGHVQ